MADCSVLIVGAGPTGLVLALWLTKQGVKVRIVDKAPEAGTTSRALAVHARTLELYEQLDLASAVVARGYTVPGFRLWLGGEERARAPFDRIASELTPYGFLHIFPQDEHERLLIEKLRQLGVEVEYASEYLGHDESDGEVHARIRGPDGAGRNVSASFLAGCDGARSKVRETIGAGFPGGTYPQVFYVADVSGEGPAFNGDLNVDLDAADFLAVFPLAHKGRVRLIGAIKAGEARPLHELSFDDVSDRATRSLGLKVDRVNWFSTYHVHHRVTETFRRGRAFLLGDASHIHTPVGGQGMNTGIGDAINLAWKLKAVLSAQAPDSLLDSYEAERRAFALRLVNTTDRLFTFASAEGRLAQAVRSHLAPLALPELVRFDWIRNRLYRIVSQLTLNYRGKGLDSGRAGAVAGGDRLPRVKVGPGDNYAALVRIGWQAHVYGAAGHLLVRRCDALGLPLEAFAWSEAMREAGLRKDTLYLIRPDTYVALVSPEQDPAELSAYFEERQLRP